MNRTLKHHFAIIYRFCLSFLSYIYNFFLFAEDPVVSSPDVGDLSPEGPLPPLILLQQLLSAATQPSPIKAIFDRQEMEVSR